MANASAARDRILGSAIKIILTGANGAVNQSPMLEVDSFEAVPLVKSVEHWPSGSDTARTQLTGIKWRVTIEFGRRGSGAGTIFRLLRSAGKSQTQVPKLQLTRKATTDYAGSFTERYIDGTVTDGSMKHGRGDETASDRLVIEFDDFE